MNNNNDKVQKYFRLYRRYKNEAILLWFLGLFVGISSQVTINPHSVFEYTLLLVLLTILSWFILIYIGRFHRE